MINTNTADIGNEALARLAMAADSRNPASNKMDAVYNTLKNALLNNELPSGAVMTERKISEALSVSRSPVRESLKRLCSEGLLELTVSGIIIVPEITQEETMSLYDLLEVIEVHAVQKCIQKLDMSFAAALSELIQNYEDALERGDISRAVWSDYDFHIAVIRRAMFRRLEPVLFQLNGQRVRIMTSLIGGDTEILRTSLKQHKAIYSAIISRDVTASEQSVRAHVYTVKDYYRQKFSQM